ncbi:MAG: WD40 repeat domain-containing protein [Chloroflexota bacterium]
MGIFILRSGFIGQVRSLFLPCQVMDRLLNISGCQQRLPTSSGVGKLELSSQDKFLAIDSKNDSGVVIYQVEPAGLVAPNFISVGYGDGFTPASKVTELKFLPNEKQIALVIENAFIQIRDIESTNVVSQFQFAELEEKANAEPEGVPVGQFVIAGRPEPQSRIQTFWSKSKITLIFSPSGAELAIVQRPVMKQETTEIAIYKVDTGELIQNISGEYIAFSPKGDEIAVGLKDGEVSIWALENSVYQRKTILDRFEAYDDYKYFNAQIDNGDYLQYSPDGNYLAAMGVYMWRKDSSHGDILGVVQLFQTSNYQRLLQIEDSVPTSETRLMSTKQRTYNLGHHYIFNFDGERIFWIVDSWPTSVGLSVSNMSSGRTEVSPPVSLYAKEWDLEGNLVAENEFVTSPYLVSEFVDVVVSSKNDLVISMSDAAQVQTWDLR